MDKSIKLKHIERKWKKEVSKTKKYQKILKQVKPKLNAFLKSMIFR